MKNFFESKDHPSGFEENPLEKMSEEEKLEEKLQVIRFSVNQKLGAPNNYLMAKYLYQVLSDPERIENIIEELDIKDSEDFPFKTLIFRSALKNFENRKEDMDEFCRSIDNVLTRKVDYERCFYEGALDEVEKMAGRGPVRIWTSGGVHGVKDLDLPGSNETLFKVAAAKFGRIRNKIAREKSTEDQKRKFGDLRKDVISLSATEKKVGLIKGICESFARNGIDTIVVLEDRSKNLVSVMEEIKKHGDFKIVPIWVRQGQNRNSIPKNGGKTIDDYKNDFNSIDSIKDLESKLDESLVEGEKVGFIVDWDGVISSDELRQKAQNRAVIEYLKKGKDQKKAD